MIFLAKNVLILSLFSTFRLVYKRDTLLKKIRELLITFDAELRSLRHEKIHLDVDLKNADLR